MRTPADVERGATRSDDERRGVERELSDLRKEVVEARNLVIKTDNLLKNLHAELKVVSKRHEDQYRRTWFASAAAYAAFIALAAIAGLMGARAAVSSERAQVETAKIEAEQAKKRADEQSSQFTKLKGEQSQFKTESEKAYTIYKGMNDGDADSRLKGVEAMTQLDRTKLSPLEQNALDDKAGNLKKELARIALERGKTAFRKNDMKDAVVELRRYLALDPPAADAAQAGWFLGAALYQTREYDAAIEQLEKFLALGKQKNGDYAGLILGQSYVQTAKYDKAMEAFKRALAEHPASEYVPQLQAQYKIAWKAAGGGATTTAPGATPAAAPAAGAAGTPAATPAAAPAGAAATPQVH